MVVRGWAKNINRAMPAEANLEVSGTSKGRIWVQFAADCRAIEFNMTESEARELAARLLHNADYIAKHCR